MAWLDTVSAVLDAGAEAVLDARGRRLRQLPSNADLPVVVAVRMSLSFPVLLSAVPLYAIDRSLHVAGKPKPAATKIWFSDGGIGSNMPLHFFDASLPGRPTFAVNLKGEHPLHPIDPEKRAREQGGRVYLPADNQGGQTQHWPEPHDDGPAGLFRFLWQIVGTMQNWRDQIQFPYPGYRDRIVQVSQLKDEGGLNLNMPSAHISRLADAGEYAAELLDKRFRTGGGWDNHRDVRLRAFVAIVEDLLRNPNLQDVAWDEVARSVDARVYNHDQREMVLVLLERMRNLGQEFDRRGVSVAEGAPRPLPEMRISPRI
ncbi:MAG: patatin-like phospholipase family protein [Rubrivivax sp.]